MLCKCDVTGVTPSNRLFPAELTLIYGARTLGVMYFRVFLKR
jgi:hypothetical protein